MRNISQSIGSVIVGFMAVGAGTSLAGTTQPPNVVLFLSDDLGYGDLACYGHPYAKTPNLDQLARDGTRLANFYSACPVCTPARTVILTGHSIDSNRVLNNGDASRTDAPPFPSFDQILLRHGYRGEYHGKFHSPYKLAMEYTQPVRWLNGKNPPPGCKADMSESEAFFKFVEEHAGTGSLKPGQLTSRHGPYTPIPLDENYGKPPVARASQAGMYGRLDVPRGCSLTAFTAEEGIAAMERLKDGPFTLTISIGPPHPPMVVSEPYFSLHPPETMPVPVSMSDPRSNSPYRASGAGENDPYRNPTNIRQMTSIYYGMVAEVDEWVGKILQQLDEFGLANNTLVIFTSDHGESLGEHGLHGKTVFYEGSVHVPLLMRLPGVIPANTVIKAPAGHIDLFATVLDYCGQAASPSEGQSLRPLIEGNEKTSERFAVSEWASQGVPGYMVCDGRWKFMCGRSADAPSLDALYDLQNDPSELNNLIGRNPQAEQYRAEVVRMKGLLVEWLTRVKSPNLESVKARPLLATPARR